jgi:UDP-GlcNAc:undecaprenyl-phosphate GlcNAc-1-phosphate transferase
MSDQSFAFLLSLLLGVGLGYPALIAARRFDLMDIPGAAPHKVHARPMPLAGGLLASGALTVMAFVFTQWLTRDIRAVLAGALVVFLFGLWDDRARLTAGVKFAGQVIASSLLVFFGVQVRFMVVLSESGVISPGAAQALNILITVFWLVGITNALNMIDSMDGIAAGLGVIAFACFWAAAALAGQEAVAFWSAVLLGICAGLYYWNGIASRFFLGDSGAQTLGFLLAAFGMMYNPLNRSPESSWIVPILLLGVPIFDTTLVVLSRLKRRQPVGSGRRDHTYHRFIALGLAPKAAVWTVHVMSLILSALAFFTFYLPPSYALAFFGAVVIIGMVFLLWLERKPTLDAPVEEIH